ncbi:MAG: hypothetical protein KC593_20370 [Myxococcales bacterium]|nr:hypothetical protein [Myxococcales bacterium]
MADALSLAASMRATPTEALPAVQSAFSLAHVYLTEAHLLGGLALVVHWDMEDDHRADIIDQLGKVAVTLDADSLRGLQAPWTHPLEGSLHVTLLHGGPDVKVPVPAVPG